MEAIVARYRSVLILCSTLSLVTGGLIGFFTPHPQRPPLAVATPEPTPTPTPTATPSPLRIYVSGAVMAPAVYRLPPGSLVEDAIRAAGGAAVSADLDHVNLAQELSDQQQVYVPAQGEIDALPQLPDPVPPDSTRALNINTATVEELERLPQVGPTTAQRIVEYRETYGPFAAIEEIMQVPGIGPATFEQICDQITISE
ncbi:MAG: helix-hairpin-helix domain-containing protein [Anaerolineae bacterium]|nr:helix-hairpin-helix domain-containing protein [Anaerolineae bacterium]